MISKTFLLRPLAIAALVATGGAANATITVYTSLAAFNAATAVRGTDTFAGLSISGPTPSPLTRSAGAFGYTATTASSFYGAGTAADPSLTSFTSSDTLAFGAFTGGVIRAIGGNFYGTDVIGGFSAGTVTLVATDASGSVSQTLSPATQAGISFLGFVSTSPILSMTLSATQPVNGFLWPTVDNLVLATVSAVPEPKAYVMLFAGLGLMGFMANRRRRG